jgi:hypothetical protein
VSGTRVQSVVEFELNPLFGDPREQIRRATCELPAGTNVRVVCTMKPIPLGFPLITYLDTEWYRADLNWQFKADPQNWELASGWQAIASYLGGSR